MNFELTEVAFSYNAGYENKRKALIAVSLLVRPGECIGVLGHEGAGKTTLLQLMVGLLRPDSGSVRIRDLDIWQEPGMVSEVRQRIGFAFQFPEQQFFCETVREELSYIPEQPATPYHHMSAEDALSMVNLRPELYLNRSPFSLSMGEARRVALALLFMRQPQALLLDEPTAGLDGAGIEIVLNLLYKARSEGTTVVVISHDVDVLSEVTSRIIIMEGGSIKEDGPVQNILNKEELLLRHGYQLPEAMRVVRERARQRRDASEDKFFRFSEAKAFLQLLDKKSAR